MLQSPVYLVVGHRFISLWLRIPATPRLIQTYSCRCSMKLNRIDPMTLQQPSWHFSDDTFPSSLNTRNTRFAYLIFSVGNHYAPTLPNEYRNQEIIT